MKLAIKYIVLAIFALVIVASVILMGSVKINYNISDYLDDSTETKISLDIMENEFGTTGNIQVMVEDVTTAEAHEIVDIINSIHNVLLVNFSESSEDYFKKDTPDAEKGDALFAIIVNGDEYSTTAKEVFDELQTKLAKYDDKVSYGGAVVEKIDMRNTMRSEIVIILVISVVFAMLVMLVMATSWLEPLILLLSSGVAVLINMGTNAVFGEISYITNAVAAILQLALSVDYSIVLLHNYRALKNEYSDNQTAMFKAIKTTFRPVLASALTTIAGLLALLFMTMKIGFDIGIVLTKGIAISVFTALTLLPALLLVCDRIMQKTSKKDFVFKGKQFCKIALKGGRAILLVGFALIVACGGLHLNNQYSFVDSANTNDKIADTFGSNNTIVVLYENHGLQTAWENEKELADRLKEFKTADGSYPFKGYTGYSNTVMEEYTIDMAAEKLGMPRSDIETLFALYHSRNNNPEEKPLSPIEFVNFAAEFLTPEEGEDYKYADENTVRMMQTLSVIHTIVTGKHTADEMYQLVSSGVMEGTGLSEFQVRQMYGLYLWEAFDNENVSFEQMLNFMVEMSKDEYGKTLMDEQTATDLTDLANGLVDFKEQMNMTVDQQEFRDFGKEKFGDEWWVQLACDALFSITPQEDGRAKIYDILVKVDGVSNLIPSEEIKEYIKNYTFVYDVIDDPCPYDEFLPLIGKLVLALTNEEREVNATETAVQQAYIMYFDKQGDVIPNEEIVGFEFVKFVIDTINTNPTVSDNVSEDSKLKLLDVLLVKNFVCDDTKYNYKDMTTLLMNLKSQVQSMSPSDGDLNENNILAIYTAEAAEHEEGSDDPIIAKDLLDYVNESKDKPGHILANALTDADKAKVEERNKAMVAAKTLFFSENYNRMLISVNLPNETENDDAERFVEELMDAVEEVFCEHAHVAGQMISTYELQQSFDKDNQIITVVTIISIFLIIALVFTSISLPVLLVAIIQGAIWISMSLSLITGPMFFMSYIIATCILMGSTIDYGILMSTNYLEYRKTMNKKDALYSAVAAAMPTIFTSGIILIICGFIVGFVASLTSISTVGFLLGKGTFVSVLMILFVLPSVLYLLDGFITKLTYRIKTKEERAAIKEKRKAKKEARLAKKAEKEATKNAK